MISSSQIKPEAPVICCDNARLGVVDHLEGKNKIKLKKDDRGVHHFIPLEWVTNVDDKIHIRLADEQARKEWLTEGKDSVESNLFDREEASEDSRKYGFSSQDQQKQKN